MLSSHSEVDPNDLDPILGPLLASSSGSAEARVLALLVKGISAEVPVEPIRLWIKSRCVNGYMLGSASDSIGGRHDPDERRGPSRSRRSRGIAHEMRSLTDSTGWGQLVDSARGRVISSSGDARDSRGASLDIALRVVAGVLMELPGDPVMLTRNVAARAVLMTMGLRMLDDEEGWDSVIASQPWLAAELGIHWQTVASALTLLVDRGTLTNPRSRKFVPSRYRVRKLIKTRLKDAQRWESVGSDLVDGEVGGVATVLRSVTHPVWTYSDVLGLMHWLMLLADTAEIDPATFEIRPKMAKRLRRELTAKYKLVPAVVARYSGEILDRLADDEKYGITEKATGARITAREAKARAMTAYQEQAAANKEAAQTATKAKKDSYETLAKLLEQHPIPRSPFRGNESTREARETGARKWIGSMHDLILRGNPSAAWRKIIGARLTERLVKDLYKVKFAEAAVAYIMHAPCDAALDEWMALSGEGMRSAVAGELSFEWAVRQSRAEDASTSDSISDGPADDEPSLPSRRRRDL